jgi:hypothetical protein
MPWENKRLKAKKAQEWEAPIILPNESADPPSPQTQGRGSEETPEPISEHEQEQQEVGSNGHEEPKSDPKSVKDQIESALRQKEDPNSFEMDAEGNEFQVAIGDGQELAHQRLGPAGRMVRQIVNETPEGIIWRERQAEQRDMGVDDLRAIIDCYKATPWLAERLNSQNKDDSANARNAMRWRPIYLAQLTQTHNHTLSAMSANVSRATAWIQRKEDEDFARQCDAACNAAKDLLFASCWKSAVEGDRKPVWHQGAVVGYVVEYDTPTRLKLLSGLMKEQFGPPAQVNVQQNNNMAAIGTGQESEGPVLTQEEILKLQERRRESIMRIKAAKAVVIEEPNEEEAGKE